MVLVVTTDILESLLLSLASPLLHFRRLQLLLNFPDNGLDHQSEARNNQHGNGTDKIQVHIHGVSVKSPSTCTFIYTCISVIYRVAGNFRGLK